MDTGCVECNVISLHAPYYSVNVSVCLVCCWYDSFCELFEEIFVIFLGVDLTLLLNAMEVLSVGRGALLDRPKSMCMLCL